MDKTQLIDLLERLYDYMENLADVEDRETDVDHPQAVGPNQEMRFQQEIKEVLNSMGVDPDAYKYQNMQEQSKKVIKLTESDLASLVKRVISEQNQKKA